MTKIAAAAVQEDRGRERALARRRLVALYIGQERLLPIRRAGRAVTRKHIVQEATNEPADPGLETPGFFETRGFMAEVHRKGSEAEGAARARSAEEVPARPVENPPPVQSRSKGFVLYWR
jgi:hypothetical protein